jgi:hypothetical protein
LTTKNEQQEELQIDQSNEVLQDQISTGSQNSLEPTNKSQENRKKTKTSAWIMPLTSKVRLLLHACQIQHSS